jgi:hypothetical protein
MSFTNPKPLGWALREKLTSADLNAVLFAIQSGFSDELGGRLAGDAALQAFVDELTLESNRALGSRALTLHGLDLGGVTPADTNPFLGVASAPLSGTLIAKTGANGAFRVVNSPLVALGGVAVASITSQCRKIVFNGSRHLACGLGGNSAAFSLDNGATWTASSNAGPDYDCVWDGTQFVGTQLGGASRHSTNGVTWTAASTLDVGSSGSSPFSLAALASGAVVAVGNNAGSIRFVRSTDHGVTWAFAGGTVASPTNYGTATGCVAGNGSTEIYWAGQPSGVSSTRVDFFVSSDGNTWTLRSQITGLTIGGVPGVLTPHPRLLMCQDTGLLVALVTEANGTVAAAASRDKGVSWSPIQRYAAIDIASFGIARGRLFATIGAKLYASQGWGA